VHFIDENTGATDIVMDPSNSNILYVATYQRRRAPWGFNGGGPGSGIYKTENGGQTWTRLQGNGLPRGTMGRVSLDVSRSNPNIVYAQIEVRDLTQPAPARGGGGGGGEPGGGRGRGGQEQPPAAPDPNANGVYRSEDKGRTWRVMSNENSRPMYFSQLRIDPTNPQNIWVAGLPYSLSRDGGRTFTPTQGQGHVDQHALWINPKDGRHIIAGNDGGIDVSYDMGETFESPRTEARGLFYQVSVDMRRPYYVCGGLQDNGSWCGPSAVRNGQILGQDWYGVGGGDGFYTQVDPTDWTVMYSESQNGNVNRWDLRTGQSKSIRPTGAGGGGRGGGGGGGGGRGGGGPGNIIPPLPADDAQIRFNWNTPVVLSPHDPSTVYIGGNRLFISRDRGETFRASPDLTKRVNRDTLSIMGVRGSENMMSKNDGTNAWSTIVTIAESPSAPGVIWVGTDDGNVQVSRDNGVTFTNVGTSIAGAPPLAYVSRVEGSYFDPATAYISFDAHRQNDHKPYVFVTRDYGRTWSSISSNLPAFGNVNVVKQDPRNKDVLYVGTEYGFFISLNEGREWKRFMNNLPVGRIDDVVVHPRDGDLVLGTHHRSVWIMDDITSIQQLTPQVQGSAAHLFDVRPAVAWLNDRARQRSVTGQHNFTGENAQGGTAIQYYLNAAPTGEVVLTISNVEGTVLRTLNASREVGINRVQWNLQAFPQGERAAMDEYQRGQAAAAARGGGAGAGGGRGGGGGGGGRGGGDDGPQQSALSPGTYVVTLTVGGRSVSKPVTILQDVWMNQK
jgi:hypothetical protein